MTEQFDCIFLSFAISFCSKTTQYNIEENKGPVVDECDRINLRSSENADPMSLLRNRLHQLGLEAVDCGGGGDCFFRSVSHQMFGSAVNHFEVRLAGVQYVREDPEQFKEFVQEQSWSDYLSSMCRQGTWCDAAIIQGVADAYNLRINSGACGQSPPAELHC